VVFDSNGKGYSFVTGGNAPSAPQPGWNPHFDKTEKIQAIAQNWEAIVERRAHAFGCQNDVSFASWFDDIFGLVESLVSDIGTAIEDVTTVLSFASAA